MRAWVPRDFRVEVETGAGRVDVTEVGSVAARTGQAPIRVERVAGSAELHTAGGEVQVDSVPGALALTATGRVHRIEADPPGGDRLIGDAGLARSQLRLGF